MGSRIFISYSQRDGEIAERLRVALEQAGLNPWIDRMEIKPGDSFLQRMNDGLSAASYVLVLLSPYSLASRWVTREWLAALADEGTVLIPILVDDCDIPPLLRDIARIDLRAEPQKGIDEVVAFIRSELAPLPIPKRITRGQTPTAAPLILDSTPRKLRLVALTCMGSADLEGFMFDADIDSGEIAGLSLHEKITALLTRAKRDGLLVEFALWLSREPRLKQCLTRRLRELAEEPEILRN